MYDSLSKRSAGSGAASDRSPDGRAVLDEVREVLDELGGALPARVVRLRQGEDLLELVEDEQGNDRLAVRVLEDVVAVVQELPERFACLGDTRLRPLARGLRRAGSRWCRRRT